MPKNPTQMLLVFFTLLLINNVASADNYVWKSGYTSDLYSTADAYPTPFQACQETTRRYGMTAYFIDAPPEYVSDKNFQCIWLNKITGQREINFYNSWRLGTGCNGIYENLTGQCLPAEEEKCECDTFNVFGNSIAPTTGANAQREFDFEFENGITAERFYNSQDDKWRHAYSTELIIKGNTVLLTRPNGKTSIFSISGGTAYSQGAEKGTLTSTASGWDYIGLGNHRMYFDASGKLAGFQPPGKLRYNVTYSGSNLTVNDPYRGTQVVIEQDPIGQPKKVTGEGATITYQYNSHNRLVKATTLAQGKTKEKQYLYEDSTAKSLLTKIIAENGNEEARFTYINRKVTSAIYGGSRENTFTYSGNGTKIKNELGKYTFFKTAPVNGINRVVAIEGEPTLNCPATTSSCTYNSRGLLQSQTDNLGRTTTFEHNDNGFEISRTEANGTVQARTITTEWHPTLPLPVKIREPGRTTRYQYDNEGRRISKTISAN